MKPSDQYAVVSPATKTGKYLVCSRRIGSREKLSPIAECRSESVAQAVVDGLHLRQKEQVKLDTSLTVEITQLKEILRRERISGDDARSNLNSLRMRVNLLERECENAKTARNSAQQRVSDLEKTVDDLQRELHPSTAKPLPQDTVAAMQDRARG